MKLKDVGEFGFIERIKRGCLIRDSNVIRGIGDDCCVFKSSGDKAILLTTDMLVERVISFLTPYPHTSSAGNHWLSTYRTLPPWEEPPERP